MALQFPLEPVVVNLTNYFQVGVDKPEFGEILQRKDVVNNIAKFCVTAPQTFLAEAVVPLQDLDTLFVPVRAIAAFLPTASPSRSPCPFLGGRNKLRNRGSLECLHRRRNST